MTGKLIVHEWTSRGTRYVEINGAPEDVQEYGKTYRTENKDAYQVDYIENGTRARLALASRRG